MPFRLQRPAEQIGGIRLIFGNQYSYSSILPSLCKYLMTIS